MYAAEIVRAISDKPDNIIIFIQYREEHLLVLLNKINYDTIRRLPVVITCNIVLNIRYNSSHLYKFNLISSHKFNREH